MISWKIKKVKLKTKKYFEAEYKKHIFIIKWEKNTKSWLINVIEEKTGSLAYLGYWGNETENIDDAIYEAMRGSGLI